MGVLHLSLRRRLLILTAIALAPAVALLAWTEFELRRAREAEIHELALRYGQLASLELAALFDGARSLLLAVAKAPIVSAFEGEACDAYLASVADDTPHFTALAALDATGETRCDSLRSASVPPASDRAYVAEAMESGRFVIGTYQIGRVSGRKVLPLAMPLRDADHRLRGVLVAYLDLGWLGQNIKERGLGTGSALTIADRNGIIVAREPLPERFVGTRIPPAFDALVHAEAPGTREITSQDGTRRVIGYYPVGAPPHGLYVSAGISEEEAFRAIDETRSRSLAIILLGGFGSLALASTMGRRFIRRPVAHLLDRIEAWRRGDFTARTAMDPRTGELEAVGAAFDRLVEELALREAARERAEAQRQLLVSELSHRVKNTLALAQAIAIQSLRGAGDVATARDTFLSRLRALADAHDVLTAGAWDAAGICDVLERTLRPYREGGAERIALSGPDLHLQPRAALAIALAVHELATNALKYGALRAETGRVVIAWNVEGSGPDGRFRLDWTEQGGPPVEPPARAGFGSRLIEGALGAELRGRARLDFAPDGVRCRLDAPLRTVDAAFAEA